MEDEEMGRYKTRLKISRKVEWHQKTEARLHLYLQVYSQYRTSSLITAFETNAINLPCYCFLPCAQVSFQEVRAKDDDTP